mmetsp:Transcript_22108/g.63394  ORF Transcript_22108/g.63394 Transcript_22108/m.63394 type:complete len:82 (-) Transcript_22108:623-868(-)
MEFPAITTGCTNKGGSPRYRSQTTAPSKRDALFEDMSRYEAQVSSIPITKTDGGAFGTGIIGRGGTQGLAPCNVVQNEPVK